MRLESLTIARFVAAIVVVLFHFAREAMGWSGAIVAGPQMVTFFFVLSGFVMAVTYALRPACSAGPYLWARLARIGPLYFVSLALMLASFLARGRQPAPVDLALGAAFLQAWVPGHALAINPPAWSLSVEAFFYALFPLLWIGWRRGQFGTPRRAIGLALLFWLATQGVLGFALRSETFGARKWELLHYFPRCTCAASCSASRAGTCGSHGAAPDRKPCRPGSKRRSPQPPLCSRCSSRTTCRP
ncbi:MAG: acyltransferase [Planctomycetota bacterium]